MRKYFALYFLDKYLYYSNILHNTVVGSSSSSTHLMQYAQGREGEKVLPPPSPAPFSRGDVERSHQLLLLLLLLQLAKSGEGEETLGEREREKHRSVCVRV